MEKLYYAETGLGCCIREAETLNLARSLVLREAGTCSGISLIRKATEKDVEWVRAMGGYVPEVKKKEMKL